MDWKGFIVIDPNVLVGRPVLRGTRLSVDFVLELLAEGWSIDDILRNYPGLSADHVRACLAYAVDSLRAEQVFPLPSS